MTDMLESMVSEFGEEAATTKRVLERVPSDKLSWKPHQKSMSLGQLALHVASIPGNLTKLTQMEEFDVSQANFNPPEPKDLGEIHAALDDSIQSATEYLSGMDQKRAAANWSLKAGSRELFCRPRIAVIRSIMLNHWFHHRGQLSVYLRLLDVPVPVIYGRSADENPFA